MTAKVFVDTNLLLYAHSGETTGKASIAKALVRELWESEAGVLSTQVLAELYVNLTRKMRPPVTRALARDLLRQYASWHVVVIESTDVIRAAQLEEEAALSFWDALILVAAAKSGASRILTEDLNSGQTVLGVRVENPFLGY